MRRCVKRPPRRWGMRLWSARCEPGSVGMRAGARRRLAGRRTAVSEVSGAEIKQEAQSSHQRRCPRGAPEHRSGKKVLVPPLCSELTPPPADDAISTPSPRQREELGMGSKVGDQPSGLSVREASAESHPLARTSQVSPEMGETSAARRSRPCAVQAWSGQRCRLGQGKADPGVSAGTWVPGCDSSSATH